MKAQFVFYVFLVSLLMAACGRTELNCVGHSSSAEPPPVVATHPRDTLPPAPCLITTPVSQESRWQPYYWLARDGKRYVFPTEIELLSWHLVEDNAIVLTPELLASILIGGNVTMRPGTFNVRIETDDRIYAIGAGGRLHFLWQGWMDRSSVRTLGIYNERVGLPTITVSDTFFVNYSVDAALRDLGGRLPSGALFTFGSDPQRYISWRGEARPITAEAMTINGFRPNFRIVTDESYRTAYRVGAPITGYEPSLAEPAPPPF